MRKYLYLAAVAASAAAVVLPATSAYAAGHVLTIRRTGGTAVRIGAVLKAGLATGKNAVFSLVMGTSTEKLTCKSASFSATVKTNPVKPGTATESVTSEKFGKCTTNVSGVTVKSIKVGNLPYKASVSDATGFPVTVKGQSSTKPISVTVTVAVQGLPNPITCTVKTGTVKGHASNTGNTITFAGQKFTGSSGGLCPTSAKFSATFGPVVDSSVTGSPKVFVN